MFCCRLDGYLGMSCILDKVHINWQVPDYYDIIKQAMDLSTMMSKIDLHQYTTVKAFTDDINLICSNALEYNPDRDPAGKVWLLSIGIIWS